MPCRLDSLRSVRVAAGQSQQELAKASNQSIQTIVNLEQGGTVDEAQARQIAAALGSTVEDCGMASLW